MHWLTVRIDTVHGGIEDVAAMLSAIGIDNVAIEDAAEFRAFLEENRQAWDYVDETLEREMEGLCRVTFYLPETEQGFSDLARARMALEDLRARRPDCGTLLMTLDSVEEADWENNWKQYYKPLSIGKRLLIVPQWETVEAGDRIPVILDPGLTFGTGSHETTRLCLEMLDERIRGGERVLDLGCGSGILSIAALRLGAERAAAVDIDDLCRRIALDNAARNGIPGVSDLSGDGGADAPMTVLIGDIRTDPALRERIAGRYNLVLANIVADVVLSLVPLIPDYLAPGGEFLCSGIIDTRSAEVEAGLRAGGFAIRERKTDRGWCAYACAYTGAEG